MKPELQSVCKRTRSQRNQTSLLDFDGSKKRPVTAVAAPTAAESSDESPASAKAAVTTSKKRGVASSSRTSKRNEPSEKKKPPLASRGRTKKRTTAAEINAEAEAEPPIQPMATSNKRRRVAKTAAASSASRKQPPERDEEEPSASTATANAAPATKKKSKTRSAVCKQHTGVKPASKPPGKKSAEQRSKRVKQRPSKQGAKQHQSAITPSPNLLARKMAHQKNAATQELFDISRGADVHVMATPLQKIGEHTGKGEDGYGNDDEVADSLSSTHSMNRSVTIDPLDLSSKLEESLSPPSQPSAPAFHQPWMQPYTPCLPPTSKRNNNTSPSNPLSSLPKGVIDIDHFPHHCCSHSLQSHGEYSWLTSKRRCGCARDSNHCSGESLTEAYLGTYGSERYGGSVGMAATAGVEAGGTDDWKAEQWWLDQIREESERLGVEEDWRIPSPTCTLSDASSISESPPRMRKAPTSKSQLSRQFPRSITDHLDYMSRQPHITVEMRKILMDWLLEVAGEYNLSTDTFLLAVTLVDRSLACSYDAQDEYKMKVEKGKKIKSKRSIGGGMVVQKDKLQLVGCACTLIASKLIEITPPTPDDFVYISDKTYTREEILEMEALVCNTLKFQLNFHTPFHYVDRFLRASYASSESSTTPTLPLHSPHHATMGGHGGITNSSGMNNANHVLTKKLVFYLLDLAVLEYKLVSTKPSLVAASAVYLARATLGICESPAAPRSLFVSDKSLRNALKGHWSKTLEYYTGYDLWDLEETVRLLHRLQETAEENSSTLGNSFNKHKGNKCHNVALKTAVSEAELGFF
mmetsp:Transcript_33510/g.70468  ORF Transcript_33510/g.70468 Transcript_33510/m.70468 type:complete len:808 (+) Transcript_33510:129-2552(+)